MGLSGAQPLGEVKTKAPNSDYHKLEPPVAARQAQVARDYLKSAARIDELNFLLFHQFWLETFIGFYAWL